MAENLGNVGACLSTHTHTHAGEVRQTNTNTNTNSQHRNKHDNDDAMMDTDRVGRTDAATRAHADANSNEDDGNILTLLDEQLRLHTRSPVPNPHNPITAGGLHTDHNNQYPGASSGTGFVSGFIEVAAAVDGCGDALQELTTVRRALISLYHANGPRPFDREGDV